MKIELESTIYLALAKKAVDVANKTVGISLYSPADIILSMSLTDVNEPTILTMASLINPVYQKIDIHSEYKDNPESAINSLIERLQQAKKTTEPDDNVKVLNPKLNPKLN